MQNYTEEIHKALIDVLIEGTYQPTHVAAELAKRNPLLFLEIVGRVPKTTEKEIVVSDSEKIIFQYISMGALRHAEEDLLERYKFILLGSEAKVIIKALQWHIWEIYGIISSNLNERLDPFFLPSKANKHVIGIYMRYKKVAMKIFEGCITL